MRSVQLIKSISEHRDVIVCIKTQEEYTETHKILRDNGVVYEFSNIYYAYKEKTGIRMRHCRVCTYGSKDFYLSNIDLFDNTIFVDASSILSDISMLV